MSNQSAWMCRSCLSKRFFRNPYDAMFWSCCNVLICNKTSCSPVTRQTIRTYPLAACLLLDPRTDLRQFVLDGELVLRIDVSDEFSQRRFRLEDDGLMETGDLEVLKFCQTAAGVRAQPGP